MGAVYISDGTEVWGKACMEHIPLGKEEVVVSLGEGVGAEVGWSSNSSSSKLKTK